MRRIIDLDVGEKVFIGASTVELQYKSGRKARLSILADESIKIEHVRQSDDRVAGRGIFGASGSLKNAVVNGLKIG